MDNEQTAEQQSTAPTTEEPSAQQPTAADEAGKTPKAKTVDSDKILAKMQKRIDAVSGEKNDLKDENEQLKAQIKELKGKSEKSVKELSEDDKTKQAMADKDKQIADLQNQIAHNKAVKDTMQVFNDSGFYPSEDVVNLVVASDAQQTYDNTKAILDLISEVQDQTKKGLLKGKTPRVTGNQALTKEEIMKIPNKDERVKAIREHLDLFNQGGK